MNLWMARLREASSVKVEVLKTDAKGGNEVVLGADGKTYHSLAEGLVIPAGARAAARMYVRLKFPKAEMAGASGSRTASIWLSHSPTATTGATYTCWSAWAIRLRSIRTAG